MNDHYNPFTLYVPILDHTNLNDGHTARFVGFMSNIKVSFTIHTYTYIYMTYIKVFFLYIWNNSKLRCKWYTYTYELLEFDSKKLEFDLILLC